MHKSGAPSAATWFLHSPVHSYLAALTDDPAACWSPRLRFRVGFMYMQVPCMLMAMPKTLETTSQACIGVGDVFIM